MTTELSTPESEKLFQCYTSPKRHMKFISPEGTVISFSEFKFITQDKAAIKYLDSQLDTPGFNVVKGKPMTSDEASPMAALKRSIIEEYLSKQAEAAVPSRDMGSTEQVSVKSSVMTSDKVAAPKK